MQRPTARRSTIAPARRQMSMVEGFRYAPLAAQRWRNSWRKADSVDGDKELLQMELQRIDLDEDIYVSVVVAAFGGIIRHRSLSPQNLHPLFMFMLCLPLFFVQCNLIMLLELDFDTTTPVLAAGSRNPTALLFGKVLMVVCLQLILFDELCQSLRLLLLLCAPSFWTDVRRIEYHVHDALHKVLGRPELLAPLSVIALLLKTIVAFWVTLSSLSVVLASADVPTCIMNSLAVVFIVDLDEYWWAICKTLYMLDDFSDFIFELHPSKMRIAERKKSLFSCCLSDNGRTDPGLGNFLTGIFMVCIYAWQAVVVTFAIDTNVLPVSRDMCAWWRLLHGHSEFHMSPALFNWIVHLHPMNLKTMITHTADPKYYGYCNDTYKVMTLGDINSLFKKHPLYAVAGCLALVCVLGLPHLWFCIGDARRRKAVHQGNHSREIAELQEEVDQIREEEEQLEHQQEELDQTLAERMAILERRLEEEILSQISKVQAEGSKAILKLQCDFEQEAKRGKQFQSELQKFQTDDFQIFQYDLAKLKETAKKWEQCQHAAQELQETTARQLQDLARQLQDLGAKAQSPEGAKAYTKRSDAMLSVSPPTATSSRYCMSTGVEAKAEITFEAALDNEELDDEDVGVTQPNSPRTRVPSLSLTRPPDNIKELNFTMSPIAPSPNDLHITLPPHNISELGTSNSRGLDMTRAPAGWSTANKSRVWAAADQQLASQFHSFMHDMKQQMNELRQCFDMQREQKQVLSDMEAIRNEVRVLKEACVPVREAAPIPMEQDVLSQTKLVSAPHTSLYSQPILTARVLDDLDCSSVPSTLPEAPQYLSPQTCSTNPVSLREVSAKLLPHAEASTASYHPPSLMQNIGRTVVVPPRARRVVPPSSEMLQRHIAQRSTASELPSPPIIEASATMPRSVPVTPKHPLSFGSEVPRVMTARSASAPRVVLSRSAPATTNERGYIFSGEVVRKDSVQSEPMHLRQPVQHQFPR